MFKVIDKPDTGKTRKLLEECSKNGGVFVCKHPERVVEKCAAYGIDPSAISPWSYRDLTKELHGMGGVRRHLDVYIDDLDLFMDALNTEFSIEIKGCGITVED